jgi:hypothetical protein
MLLTSIVKSVNVGFTDLEVMASARNAVWANELSP